MQLQHLHFQSNSPHPIKICNFLSNLAEYLGSLQSLGIHGQEARSRRSPTILTPSSPGSGDAVIDLLTRKQGTDDGATTDDIFPNVTSLSLGNLLVSISKVLDMIESRRKLSADTPPHNGKRLLFCNLTALATEHHSMTDQELDEQMAQLARSRISNHQRDGSRTDDTEDASDFLRGVPKAEMQSYLNPPLNWKEGLRREPEQQTRMK